MSASNREPVLLEADLDEVDRLPKPRRPKLALAVLWPCILSAVEAAWLKAPEDRYRAFYRLMANVVPADGRSETLDDWARLGVFEGALAGWQNRAPYPAKETTNVGEAQTYMIAAAAARVMTAEAIAEVRRG